MVMELMRGRDLSAALRESGVFAPAVAVEYVLQACEALAEAHALGIVHRDLKPANLFLTARADGSPCVKVLDFGISKMTSPGSSSADMGMTRTQAIMGSPLYMSPEQLNSARDVDPRSDIWAVGIVLYELLTGRAPFEADTMPQLCTLILHAAPTPPRSVRPDVPARLEAVILRCLQKDRARRYQNVADLAADLAAFAPDAGPRSAERISRVLSSSGLSSTELASSNPAWRTAASSTGPSQAWGATQAGRSRRAVWLGVAGGGLALLLGILFWKTTTGASSVAGAAPSVSAVSQPVAHVPTPAAVESAPVAAVASVPSALAVASSGPTGAVPPKPIGMQRSPKGAAATKTKPDAAGKPSGPVEPGVDPLSDRR